MLLDPHDSEQMRHFTSCLTYVKRNWPDDTPDSQWRRAEAVYAISEHFFNEILPNFVNDTLKPVWN